MSTDRACAYMLASGKNGTLYIGVTSDLAQRVWQHRLGAGSAFTRKYGVTCLVWFEIRDWYDVARARERTMKEWKRAWKIALIERDNPNWDDLYSTLT
jgi:putative endonuclease